MSEELPRVGFIIGLGRMGYPIARHLLDGGVSLTVYDSDPSAMERLTVRQASSPGLSSSASSLASRCR